MDRNSFQKEPVRRIAIQIPGYDAEREAKKLLEKAARHWKKTKPQALTLPAATTPKVDAVVLQKPAASTLQSELSISTQSNLVIDAMNELAAEQASSPIGGVKT